MQLSHKLYNELSVWCSKKQPTVRTSFSVPLLGEGGTCSLFGELDPVQFNLLSALTNKELTKYNRLGC
jgi:hypothetical protein